MHSVSDEFSKDFIRIQRNPFLGIMVAIQCLQKLGSFWKEACEQDLLNMASPDICLCVTTSIFVKKTVDHLKGY
jgi:hypothetical protein